MQSNKAKKSPGSGPSSPGRSSEGKSMRSHPESDQNRTRSLSSPAETRTKHRGVPVPVHTNLEERKDEHSMTLFMVEVKLLSDEEAPLQLEVTNSCLGRALFNQVIERLNGIVAKDYFGLRYLDRNKQRQWLEMSKTVYKQLKHVTPRSLNFRVKHYPSDPLTEFRQEKTRYLLYLQLRRDLHSGRLIGRNTEMHMLAACILQAEIGDYDLLVDYLGSEGTLADLKMFANVTPRTEAKICELHKTLKGLTMEEAENKFLEHASRFETYGIEPLYVQDRKGNHFYMGLSHEGVVTFRGSRKAHVFTWQKINKISYEGKLFIIQVEWEQRRHTLGFKCPTADSAEALWKWAVDRQCFFTLNRSVDAKESKANGGIFKRRQFYTFTGRCQKELLLLNSSLPTIPQPSVSRSRSLLNLAKSVRQSRQSKSQNDLDRKLAVSHDNLRDGDMASSEALQRHQSVLDTRQTDEASNLIPTSNHLGQQVRGFVGNGGRAGLAKAVNNANSQSTPSLHTPPPTQQGPPISELNGVRDGTRSMQPDTVALPSEKGVSVEQVASSTEVGDLSRKSNGINILQSTISAKEDTRQTVRRQSEEANGLKSIDIDANKKTVVLLKPETKIPVEESDISDIEQHAEATDQLAEDGEAFGNTGSVNTLSSSPLHSADEEEEADVGHKAEDKQKIEENDLEDTQFADSRPTAAKRASKSLPTDEKSSEGYWLGAGGIRTLKESNTDGELKDVTTHSVQYHTSEIDNNNRTTRPSLTGVTTTTWSTCPKPSIETIDRVPAFPTAPDIKSYGFRGMQERSTRAARMSAQPVLSKPSIEPASITFTQRESLLCSSQLEPRTSFLSSTGAQLPSVRLSSEPVRQSVPSRYLGVQDVEEYIDSNGTYSVKESSSSSTTQPMATSSFNGSAPKVVPAKPLTSPPESQNDLYFPFARNMKTCPPHSNLANRPRDYKTLAAIPSRRSPTRREQKFTGSKTRSTDRNERVCATPLEINLSVENFSRTPPMMVLNRRDAPKVELVTMSQPSDKRFTRRSQDLSPQPRDWYQATNRSLSPTEHSALSSLKELVIPPSTTSSSFVVTHSVATSPTHPPVEEVYIPSRMTSCGFYSSSLPSSAFTTTGKAAFPEDHKSPVRSTADILLEHGYRPSVAGHQSRVDSHHIKTTEQSRPYRGLGSSAAQLAAGGILPTHRVKQSVSSTLSPLTDLDAVVTTSSTGFAQLSVPGIAQPESELSVKADGDMRLQDQPQTPREPMDTAEQLLADLERLELRSRLNTTSTTSQVSTETKFRRPPLSDTRSPPRSPETTSMKDYAQTIEATLRSAIDAGQRSVSQLTGKLTIPPLAQVSTTGSTGSTQTPAPPPLSQNIQQPASLPITDTTRIDALAGETTLRPLLQQLFYYFLVGFFVFKLTRWMGIRPSFNQSDGEENILIRLLRAIFGFIFSLD